MSKFLTSSRNEKVSDHSRPQLTVLHNSAAVFALLLLASLGIVAYLGRSTPFTPKAWFNIASLLVWLGTAALILAAIAIRMHFMKEPKGSFSRNSLMIIAGAVLMGFGAREVVSGAGTLANPWGAVQRTHCFVLAPGWTGPSARVRNIVTSNVRLPGEDAQVSRPFRYSPKSIDLSKLTVGDTFALKVLEGRFGYTPVEQQTLATGCTLPR